MNATSLYVSTCRVVLGFAGDNVDGGEGDASDETDDMGDLYKLLPYLRAALSCAVCGGLLKCAASPSGGSCPHAVCRGCRNGRKRLKPACPACRDLQRYDDNCQLRILLQSYKRLCEYFAGTEVYRRLARRTEDAAAGLVDLVQEGVKFSDGYESTAGLSKSAYQALPCIYTNSSTQTRAAEEEPAPCPSDEEPRRQTPHVYSVTCAPTGNKITIKRKQPDDEERRPAEAPVAVPGADPASFKKPSYRSRSSGGKRKGCRCGNATATPGKLTCCGQRCPCYVESKACSECKCKGCRNPHRADGMKVRPRLPDMLVENENDQTSVTTSEQLNAEHMNTLDETSENQMLNAMLTLNNHVDTEETSPSPPPSEDESESPESNSPPLAARRSFALPTRASYTSHRRSSRENGSDIEVDV